MGWDVLMGVQYAVLCCTLSKRLQTSNRVDSHHTTLQQRLDSNQISNLRDTNHVPRCHRCQPHRSLESRPPLHRLSSSQSTSCCCCCFEHHRPPAPSAILSTSRYHVRPGPCQPPAGQARGKQEVRPHTRLPSTLHIYHAQAARSQPPSVLPHCRTVPRAGRTRRALRSRVAPRRPPSHT